MKQETARLSRTKKQQIRSPAPKERTFTLRFRLRWRTEAFLLLLTFASGLLPKRLLDFSCAPLTALVAVPRGFQFAARFSCLPPGLGVDRLSYFEILLVHSFPLLAFDAFDDGLAARF